MSLETMKKRGQYIKKQLLKKKSDRSIKAMNDAKKEAPRNVTLSYKSYNKAAWESSDFGRCWWIYEWLMINR